MPDNNYLHLDTADSLWNFLFPDGGLQFSKRQFDYMAFWLNYNKNFRYIYSWEDLPRNENCGETVQKYKNYYIPKSDWTYRIIREPCYILKQIQKALLYKIFIPYSNWLLSANCTGFRKDFSIVHNAQFHLGKEILIKLDIADFFPSISQARIYGFIKKKLGFNHRLCSYISWFCTYKNELPQWAPTSPIIANIIWSHIDNRILKLVQSLNSGNPRLYLSYSRYADDMTLSYNDKALNPNKLISLIQSIIEDEWFLLNLRKIRLFRKSQKQEVTWIIVNNGETTIWRKRYKFFRAIIHSIKTVWWDGALNRWNSSKNFNRDKISSVNQFKQVMKWYHDYIYMVNKNGAHEKYLQDFRSIFD